MGYDAKKAETFNKLRQDGVSEDQALAQAGITDADVGNYALGSNGQMGALIVGSGKVAGVDYDKLSPAELREQARFDQGLRSVDYDVKDSDPPSSTTPITYTTTSTETVSGGGSTTIIAGPRQSNTTSQAIGSAYDAKNAEYNQFVKDNPSDFARKRQGLPPLTPAQAQQRQQNLDTLNREKESLKNQQIDAETPSAPSIVTTPNTTTTTTTVTTGRVATNEQVNIQNDEAQFQQSEQQIENQTPEIANGVAAREPQNVAAEDDPFEARRLELEQEFNEPPPTLTAEDVGEEDPFEARRLELEQEQNREELAASNFDPEPVGDEDPFEARRLEREQEFDEPPPTLTADDVANDDPAVRALDEESRERAQAASDEDFDPDSDFNADTKAKLLELKNQATLQERFNQTTKSDWRVRLRLAPDANYLYQDPTNKLLSPLKVSDGVVFPYTPIINTNYSAKYDPYDLTHSNYRGYFYRSSQVSEITVQATFTAQDTREAEYVLAVIHFFKSATKMFYGQDPQRGAPPPLVYLRGYGEYQFNDHACVISNFQYNLPNDVDYISISPNNIGLNLSNRLGQVGSSPTSTLSSAVNRLGNLFNAISGQPGVPRGAKPGERTDLGIVSQTVNGTGQTSYVPTKIDLSITLLPVQTRSQVSKQFSVKEFSNGNLLRKGFW
jgi:hypothetical protein